MSHLLDRVSGILANAPDRPQPPTGISRTVYLDLIERILNVAVAWQDNHGAIIDPVINSEHGQTSCRFVAPGAVLLSAGRGAKLREHVLRGMDWCCRRLASGEGDGPDFWMRELMTAYTHLADADSPRRAQWAEHIRAVDCEKIYKQVSPDGSKLLALGNWTVYAAAGEAMREMAGLGPKDPSVFIWGRRFWEKYMPGQFTHFSEHGMYRDPGDPFTYDFTTRLQIATPIALGFESATVAKLKSMLDLGMFAQLLYVSPEGFSPFGGRSNQLHIQEAILAALCEIAARRYRYSDLLLARVFKRQAHVHTMSMLRWLDMQPMRQIKNGFDPSTTHGCEGYSKYSKYMLFTASCLALAYQFADETIEEGAATPAEIGGYAFELKDAFHKVFASVGRTQIEIDTKADPHYDATGLGRFHRAGIPLELGLSMPLPSHPKFHIPKELLPPHDFAIGPSWCIGGTWTDLAAFNKDVLVQTEIERETAREVVLSVNWTHEPTHAVVHQRYFLTEGRVRIDAEVTSPHPVQAMRFTVPLLQTDGAAETKIEETERSAIVQHASGAKYRVTFAPEYKRSALPPAANRNGVYQPLVLETQTARMSVTLTL